MTAVLKACGLVGIVSKTLSSILLILKFGVILPTRTEPPATVFANGAVNSNSNCPVPLLTLTSFTVFSSLNAGAEVNNSIIEPCLNTETAAPNWSSNCWNCGAELS